MAETKSLPVLIVLMIVLVVENFSHYSLANFLENSSNISVNEESGFEKQPSKQSLARMTECHLRPVVHIIQHPGCVPKAVSSFACYGACSSFVQVSSSKFWQLERSCSCCQEIGERETSVTLHCPKQNQPHQTIITVAPAECLCRPCTAVDAKQIKAQEIHDMNSKK